MEGKKENVNNCVVIIINTGILILALLNTTLPFVLSIFVSRRPGRSRAQCKLSVSIQPPAPVPLHRTTGVAPEIPTTADRLLGPSVQDSHSPARNGPGFDGSALHTETGEATRHKLTSLNTKVHVGNNSYVNKRRLLANCCFMGTIISIMCTK